MLDKFSVNIEVVGTCNLVCPSCPVGSYGKARRDPALGGSIGGTMPVERFTGIVRWLERELRPHHPEVMLALYSWGEPLIHPRLGELIAIGHAAGFRVGLSSNLNHVGQLKDSIAAGVDELVISLSGASQDIYAQTHRGGDIAKVKANMAALADLIRAHRAATDVHVHYITYRHNAFADVDDMVRLCDRLGFHFSPSPAYLMPVEKLVSAAEGRIDPADQAVIDRLLVPLADQLAAARAATTPHESCDLIETRLDIDVDGAVKLCCSSYERRHNVAAGLEGLDLAAIQASRRASALCGACMPHGIHRIYTRKDWADTVARADAVLATLGSEHRFAAPGGLGGQVDTERTRLDRMLRAMNAGDLAQARALRDALHEEIAARYSLDLPLADTIEARLDQPGARLGRDLPWDPARLLFADAVLARNLAGDPRRSHALLLAIGRIMDRLGHEALYRDTIADMRGIVAEWLALPA